MAGNEAKPHNSVLAVTDEMPRTELIDVEEITCSPQGRSQDYLKGGSKFSS